MESIYSSITKDVEISLNTRVNEWKKMKPSSTCKEFISFLNSLHSTMGKTPNAITNPLLSQIIGLYIARKTIEVMNHQNMDSDSENANT